MRMHTLLKSVKFTMLSAGLLSLMLHIVVGALLIISFNRVPTIENTAMQVDIVKAVSVDKKQLNEELTRLKKIDEEKRFSEEKRVAEAAQKVKEIEKKRKQEEKKFAEAKQKKERERKQREAEQKKLAVLEKEKAVLQKQRKEEEKLAETARQREAEAVAKRREEEARLARAEAKRREEEARLAKLKKEAEERKKREAELEAELEAEQRAEQKRNDTTLKNRTIGHIRRRISGNFNRTGLPDGLKGVLQVHLVPGGEVIDVHIKRSSGNDVFDSRAILAAQKASPLPVPDDAAAFERLGFREITLNFQPTD